MPSPKTLINEGAGDVMFTVFVGTAKASVVIEVTSVFLMMRSDKKLVSI